MPSIYVICILENDEAPEGNNISSLLLSTSTLTPNFLEMVKRIEERDVVAVWGPTSSEWKKQKVWLWRRGSEEGTESLRRRAQRYPRWPGSIFLVLFGKMTWRQLGSFASCHFYWRVAGGVSWSSRAWGVWAAGNRCGSKKRDPCLEIDGFREVAARGGEVWLRSRF